MAVSIAVLPGDGIGPEITAPTLELLVARGRLRLRRAPLRRRLDRRPRHGADRRDAGRLPRVRRRPARRRRRPEVGQHRPAARRGPSRACSDCARRWACTPTCARCAPSRRSWTPARCGARSSSAPTCSSCASSPAASTSARRRAPTTAPATCASTPTAEIERIARVAFARGALEGHERRQGQRAGDQPPVARGRAPRPRAGVPARRARARARRLDRDEAHHRPAPLRRDPHREHVRRHPQRRGVGGHGVAGTAAQRLDRGRRTRASSSPSTAPRPTSRARGSPTRWPCSCPPRCMLRHGLGRESEASAVESAVDRALDEGLRTRDLGGTASTAEATQAVLAHLD